MGEPSSDTVRDQLVSSQPRPAPRPNTVGMRGVRSGLVSTCSVITAGTAAGAAGPAEYCSVTTDIKTTNLNSLSSPGTMMSCLSLFSVLSVRLTGGLLAAFSVTDLVMLYWPDFVTGVTLVTFTVEFVRGLELVTLTGIVRGLVLVTLSGIVRGLVLVTLSGILRGFVPVTLTG